MYDLIKFVYSFVVVEQEVLKAYLMLSFIINLTFSSL